MSVHTHSLHYMSVHTHSLHYMSVHTHSLHYMSVNTHSLHYMSVRTHIYTTCLYITEIPLLQKKPLLLSSSVWCFQTEFGSVRTAHRLVDIHRDLTYVQHISSVCGAVRTAHIFNDE
eukprot:GHVS01076750.1.p1 GENE.GHVS01076750.1~~GHVS01076750.1.p1  ORF type:complete len:117 (-),score=17.43 GHVS01076750.1:17-367(-)